jgi:hypothetical protein
VLPSASGGDELLLYPTPGSGGDTLELEWVFRAPELTVDEPSGEPSELPPEFHAGLLSYCASVYYETVEDNPELAQRNNEKWELVVAEVQRYAVERASGNGIFQIPILGVTA